MCLCYCCADLSLAVEHGCFGLLGPNGAGKTTAISVLTGLYAPSGGTATVAGFDIRKDMSSIEQHMGICPQFDCLFPGLSVRDHLLFYAALKGTSREKEAETVAATMQAVGLGAVADRAAAKLSGGMRRRLSLGMALIGNPSIVFLDGRWLS